MTEATQVPGVLDSHGERAAPLQTVYVYEAPVRLWHWVNALAIVVLATTGYFIASPLRRRPADGLHTLRPFDDRLAWARLLGVRRQRLCAADFRAAVVEPKVGLRRCLRTALVFILGHAAAKASRTRSASAFFHALYFMLPLTRMVVTGFALFKGRGRHICWPNA